MHRAIVFGFILLFLNKVCRISAETDTNFDHGEVSEVRNRRDVNADKIFVEINHLYDKIDELSKQFEQMREDIRKTKTELGEKIIVTQQHYAGLENKVEQNELTEKDKFAAIDSKLVENVHSISELSTQFKQHEHAEAIKFTEMEEKFNQTEQLMSQQYDQLFNIIQHNISESNPVSESNFDTNLNEIEESMLQKRYSNRIKDGPSQCRLWPGGKVSFEIGSSINNNTRNSIEEAINDFHNKTCIRWIPRQSSQVGFVYFVTNTNKTGSTNNKTEECYTGGRRLAIVGEESTQKEVLRQMAYILGFGDEHLRHDRDEHIKVRRSTCRLEEKYPHLNGGGFYDYHSIMHPSCDKTSCLQRKDYSAWRCGIPNSLSVLDAEKLNEMYNCKGCHSLRFQFPDQIGFNESELVPVFDNAHQNRKYICRVRQDGNVIIGRGNVKTGECHYEYDTTEVTTENVQFLTSRQQTAIHWVPRGSDFPANAIPGGSSIGEPLYIARCPEEPQWGESVVPWQTGSLDTLNRMYKRDGSYNYCSSFDLLACL